jgi:hypothetical protein
MRRKRSVTAPPLVPGERLLDAALRGVATVAGAEGKRLGAEGKRLGAEGKRLVCKAGNPSDRDQVESCVPSLLLTELSRPTRYQREGTFRVNRNLKLYTVSALPKPSGEPTE